MIYKIVSLILLVIVAPILVIYLVKSRESLGKNELIDTEPAEEEPSKYDPYNNYPLLDLPMEYFSEEDIQWGSVLPKTTGKTISEYREVALGNKAVYQSYPTTEITIKEYSDEIQLLKVKSFIDIKKEIGPVQYSSLERAEEDYDEYGDLATHYLPDYSIESSDQFDVDSDGKKELIITYNFMGRATAGSYSTDIIKGNNIIFSVNEDNSSIVPADTSNGFYVEWRSPKQWAPRCCEPGFIRTRFIFKDGHFIPLYEQEVGYMFVGNN